MAFCEDMMRIGGVAALSISFPSNRGLLESLNRAHPYVGFLFRCYSDPDFKRLFTISEYYDRNRPGYYRALQGTRERNLDLTGWLEYFTAGLGAQLSEVQARGEGLIRQDVLALRYGLSERQKQAIQLAGEKGTFGIQDFEVVCPGVTRRTLQRELKDLVEKGVLRVEGATRNLSYSLAEGV